MEKVKKKAIKKMIDERIVSVVTLMLKKYNLNEPVDKFPVVKGFRKE